MNDLLYAVSKNVFYIIQRQSLSQDIQSMWGMISQECTRLQENKEFIDLFDYFCWRFTVSGNSRRSSFDEMMHYSFDMGYTPDRDNTLLRDMMCIYLISSFEGDKRDCRKSDWPDADLLNSIFDDEDDAGEEIGSKYFSAGRLL